MVFIFKIFKSFFEFKFFILKQPNNCRASIEPPMYLHKGLSNLRRKSRAIFRCRSYYILAKLQKIIFWLFIFYRIQSSKVPWHEHMPKWLMFIQKIFQTGEETKYEKFQSTFRAHGSCPRLPITFWVTQRKEWCAGSQQITW
jgi:hypothetical protein